MSAAGERSDGGGKHKAEGEEMSQQKPPRPNSEEQYGEEAPPTPILSPAPRNWGGGAFIAYFRDT